MCRMVLVVVLLLGPLGTWSPAQQPRRPAAPRPTPTAANLAYGKHERQVLDFWQAKSDRPTPLVLYIHGGGWQSDDPVARESTRLYCAAVNGAQTSLDPKELREWMPNYGYGAHAFGLPNFQALYENRDKVLRWIKEYSPIEHVSKDDPPIFMEYP